nr:MAG TPA: hypothetical protein [Caudoviricetes sp.]DAP87241.1 MAG TPA: hypothetical protein [Caudoviricetes sp.]
MSGNRIVLQIIWRLWENHSELGGFFFMTCHC